MRQRTPTHVTKLLMDEHFHDLKSDTEQYEEAWEQLYEADGCATLTEALTEFVDWGPEIILAIHQRNPWTPSPDEATIMRAFFPNYLETAALTAPSAAFSTLEIDEKTVSIKMEPKFQDHLEKMVKELYERSVGELKANKPGA